jgi:hypothetical protein
LPCCQIRLKAQKPLPSAYPQTLKTLGDHLRKRRLDLQLFQKDVAQMLMLLCKELRNNNHAGTKVELLEKAFVYSLSISNL